MGHKRHLATAVALTAATLACAGASTAQPHSGRATRYVGISRAVSECNHTTTVYYTAADLNGKQWEDVQPRPATVIQTQTSDSVWHTVATGTEGYASISPQNGWPMFRWRAVSDGIISPPVTAQSAAGCTLG
jgi:hypothetical protein